MENAEELLSTYYSNKGSGHILTNVSKAVELLQDIESQNQRLKVYQGKGAKDRYTLPLQ